MKIRPILFILISSRKGPQEDLPKELQGRFPAGNSRHSAARLIEIKDLLDK